MKKSLISLGTAAAIAVGNLLPAKSAHAATDCTYKVLYVYTEAGVASPKVAIGMVGASSPWIWSHLPTRPRTSSCRRPKQRSSQEPTSKSSSQPAA